jgi:hypothetical protein
LGDKVLDKSLQYIEMCEKAVEIQKTWTPSKGDWYALPNKKIEICLEDENPRTLTKNCLEISSDNSNVVNLTKRTWLPRQDQLIELSKLPGIRFSRNTLIFLEWANRKGPDDITPNKHRFDTLEKARLSYLMEFKFRKTWYNNTWYSMDNKPA